MGGVTPEALGADWLASTLDQVAYSWMSSPFAARLEQVSLDWLKELFGLSAQCSAVITTRATTANLDDEVVRELGAKLVSAASAASV